MGLATVFAVTNNYNPATTPAAYSAALAKYIFAAPQGVGQIDTFAFDYKISTQVTLNNEITDHWLEDNTAVQDHIAVKPNIVTMRGYVAELVFTESIIAAVLGTVENTLSQASAYLGKYTPGATQALLKAITQAQNVETQISQALSRAATIASFFTPYNGTRQQKAFAQLSAYRDAKVFFTVYTPFQVYNNMAITSLTAMQPERSQDYADFSVTMKQLNFVNSVAAPNAAAIQANNASIGTPTSGYQTVGQATA